MRLPGRRQPPSLRPVWFNLWQSLAPVDWSKTGGESFVQLWTGLNLAFVAWDKYKEALNLPRKKCEEIINAATCNILDRETKTRIGNHFVRWSKYIVFLLRWFWRLSWGSAIVAFGCGVYVLYVNHCGPWDWILILPTLVYVGVTSIGLFIFWIITAFVGWCVGPGGGLAGEIDKLDRSTRK